jgi:hypothetical protein
MKAYWESVCIAPRILNLGTRRRWVVSFTPQPLYLWSKTPPYPLDRRLGGGGSQTRSVCDGKEGKSHQCPWQELNSGRPARSLVTVLTELPRQKLSPVL